MKEASHYSVVNDKVKCELCPRNCTIMEGDTGKCDVRQNIGGVLQSLFYGKPCSINIDPIEKKPLYHVLPGSSALSIATIGCNMFCSFCQNWQISKADTNSAREFQEVSPKAVVSIGLRERCKNISFTYTEPTIFYEYMVDIARAAEEEDIKCNIVSNGYINEEPLRELCGLISAANIDLKAFDKSYYRKLCRARLKPVLKTLKILKEEGVWVEITNLMVPGQNDDMKQIRKMCRWIADELGPDTPLHFSRFHPDYQYTDTIPTPLETLGAAETIAREYLDFVYVGNVGYENDTLCPSCGTLLIKRKYFGVSDVRITNGRCPSCNETIPGIWD